MEVLLAKPARLLRRRRARDRDRRARARAATARRSTCATRSCTTRYVVDDLRAKGAVFVEELDEVPAGATVIFSAHGVSQAVRARGRAARPARCSTRPARWSPRCTSRSRKMLRDGLRDRDDRPPRPPGGRGHDGPGRPAGMHLVETLEDVARAAGRAARASSPTSRRPRSRWTTRAAIVAALKRALPDDPRAEEGRHLLRHAEPPGRGASSWRRSATW